MAETPETDALIVELTKGTAQEVLARDWTTPLKNLARSLETRLLAAERALCELTPGGSEYAGDVEACVKYVNDVRRAQHETLLAAQRRATAAERDAARLREALNEIASWNEGPEVNGSFDEPGSAQIARAALSGQEG